MAAIEKRITKKGAISYRVKIRMKGRPTQCATFQSIIDARIWIQQTESAIREGRYFKTVEAKRHTLAELIDRYCQSPQVQRDKHKMRHLAWWKSKIGRYLLSDITPALIVEWRDRGGYEITSKNTPRAPATVNRYLSSIAHAFTIAVIEWQWLDDSPMRRVRKLKEPRGRVRFLNDDERQRLLQACHASANPFLPPVVTLALSTGMRQGEIMNLRWSDVNLINGNITLHHTKNGERRYVPLTHAALEALRNLAKIRQLKGTLLFPSNRNPNKPIDLRKAWINVIRQAELVDFRFHDLRHSCASYLAMDGATANEIAEVLGHKSLVMVKRYAHLSNPHISKVVERMNNKIFGGITLY